MRDFLPAIYLIQSGIFDVLMDIFFICSTGCIFSCLFIPCFSILHLFNERVCIFSLSFQSYCLKRDVYFPCLSTLHTLKNKGGGYRTLYVISEERGVCSCRQIMIYILQEAVYILHILNAAYTCWNGMNVLLVCLCFIRRKET